MLLDLVALTALCGAATAPVAAATASTAREGVVAVRASDVASEASRPGSKQCRIRSGTSSYAAAVGRATRAGRDVWGDRLLAAPADLRTRARGEPHAGGW